MADASPLMAGKRGIVMGVANARSLAWGVAHSLADHGAELAFTFQGDAIERSGSGRSRNRSAPISWSPAT